MSRFITTIDADTGRVDVPLNIDLEWFDALRNGIVGIITLVPSEDEQGTWMLEVEQAPAVMAAHIEQAEVEAEAETEE